MVRVTPWYKDDLTAYALNVLILFAADTLPVTTQHLSIINGSCSPRQNDEKYPIFLGK